MKRLTPALAVAVAVLALAACGGDGYGSSEPRTVSVEDVGDAGRVLVDSAGRPLYAADEEASGGGVCTGGCASSWLPLTIGAGTPSGSGLPGELGVADRPDGTRQVTFDGKRLYTFAQDEPGEVTGDGLSDAFGGRRFTWHVVRVGGPTGSDPDGDDNGGSFGY